MSTRLDTERDNRDIMSWTGSEGLFDGLKDPLMKQTSNVMLSMRIV